MFMMSTDLEVYLRCLKLGRRRAVEETRGESYHIDSSVQTDTLKIHALAIQAETPSYDATTWY